MSSEQHSTSFRTATAIGSGQPGGSLQFFLCAGVRVTCDLLSCLAAILVASTRTAPAFVKASRLVRSRTRVKAIDGEYPATQVQILSRFLYGRDVRGKDLNRRVRKPHYLKTLNHIRKRISDLLPATSRPPFANHAGGDGMTPPATREMR